MAREATIERHLVKRIRALGGEVRKVKWLGHHGAPDRCVMMPGGVIVWVELKSTGVPVEAHQAREHVRMRAMGQRVLVIDDTPDVDLFFALPR